jgi:hypothetical protein
MKKNLVVWGTLCFAFATGCGIDLAPMYFEGPETATVGEDITDLVSVFVANQGTFPVQAEECTGIFWVYFLISEDEDIGIDDGLLNSVDFIDFPINGGRSKPVLFDDEYERLEIPDEGPLGPAYLGVFVDAHGYCTELNEENNKAALPIEILPAP